MVCSVKCTSFTRSPGLGSEVRIPFLQEHLLVFHYHPLDATELRRAESKVANQSDRPQPEFRGQIVAVDVDVRGLVWFVTMKVYSIGS